MRARLRSPAGQVRYCKRHALAEPVIGALTEQRGMRRFRLGDLGTASVEKALARAAFNLTRTWPMRAHPSAAS